MKKLMTKNPNAQIWATRNSFGLRLKSIALCLTMMFFIVSKGQTVFNNPVQIPALAGANTPLVVAGGTGTLGTATDLTILTTGSPPAHLLLNQPAPADPSYFQITNNMSINGGLRMGNPASSRIFEIRNDENANIEFFTNTTLAMTIDPTQWVGIGTGVPFGFGTAWVSAPGTGAPTFGWAAAGAPIAPKLSVAGDIETNLLNSVFSANYYMYSDERLKQDFKPITDWRKILDVNTYSFTYKDIGTKKKNGLSYGFKAQDVYKLLPELTANSGPILAVDYVSFIPFLTEGLKTHEQQLKDIELLLSNQPLVNNEKIIALEAENKILKERLDKLEAKLNSIPTTQGQSSEKNKIQIGVLKNKPVLEQNEPNPFTDKTEIRYFLPEGTTNARIMVKTDEGKIVGDFPLETIGFGSISINPGTLTAGTYYYSLVANNIVIDTKKMTLLK